MRLGAFEINEPLPELNQPHALAMLKPWIDVGSVGSLVFNWMENECGAIELGKLARPGEFFDFTRYRPVTFWQDGQRQMSVPNTTVSYSRRPGGNDFLFFHLLEPHNNAENYNEAILSLLKTFNVKRYALIGSMYDYVPHTRPLSVTGSLGQKTQDANRLNIKRSGYQGPTTITSLISQQAAITGVEIMSLIVHLPQYTQLEEDYMGAARIMESLSAIYDIRADQSYITSANRQRIQIDATLEQNPQLKGILEQLETQYDERAAKHKEEGDSRLSPEVEQFLAEMDKKFRDEPGPNR